jgi:hypothetical protein
LNLRRGSTPEGVYVSFVMSIHILTEVKHPGYSLALMRFASHHPARELNPTGRNGEREILSVANAGGLRWDERARAIAVQRLSQRNIYDGEGSSADKTLTPSAGGSFGH